MDLQSLQEWLTPLSESPVECDGLTRMACLLLEREGIDHQAHMGSMEVAGVGTIGFHMWIELEEGVIDFRARMWLGESAEVPHGVFVPGESVTYTGEPFKAAMPEFLFEVFSGQSLESFPEPPSIGRAPKP